MVWYRSPEMARAARMKRRREDRMVVSVRLPGDIGKAPKRYRPCWAFVERNGFRRRRGYGKSVFLR